MSELYSLYKLHKIDEALHSLRQQAAALDTGKGELALVRTRGEQYEEVGAKAKKLSGELQDKELQQKSLEEKLQRLDKKLYDGSIVSPKEVENVKAEIESVKEFSEKNDERLLELYEEVPPAQKLAEEIKAQLQEAESAANIKKEDALRAHAEIKAEFDRLRKERPDYLSQVDVDLIEMYDDIRKHTGDVGMTVVTKEHTCDSCGVTIPEKTMEMLKADMLVTCEECRRILYKVVPGD